MLGHGVDERIAGARMLDEEPAHTRRGRAEVVVASLQEEGDAGGDEQQRECDLDAFQEDAEHGEVLLAPLDLDVPGQRRCRRRVEQQ